MSKRKKATSLAFTGVATFGVLAGLGAEPALAAGTLTYHIKGPSAFPAAFSGTNSTSAILHAGPASGGATLNCPPEAAFVSGSIPSATVTTTSSTPAQLGTIFTATFGSGSKHCTLGTGASAPAFSAKITSSIAVMASGTPTTSSGHTKGWVGQGGAITHKIHAVITGLNFGCKMSISGSKVPAYLSNSHHHFVVNSMHSPTLHISHVGSKSTSNCLGVFHSSSPAWFAATYNTNPALSVSTT